jgi:hypothetical protein
VVRGYDSNERPDGFGIESKMMVSSVDVITNTSSRIAEIKICRIYGADQFIEQNKHPKLSDLPPDIREALIRWVALAE